MKTFATGLADAYASGGTRMCYCILVTRSDGEVFGFTSTDHPVTVLGQEYVTGLDVRSIAQSAGLAVNNLQVSALYESPFTKADFLAGRWDGAQWELFETPWDNPALGTNTIGKYVTGKVQPGELSCTIELRALSQFLQQPIGIVTSKTCRARFADYPSPVNSARCGLSASSFLAGGSITAVTSRQVVTDSSRAEADDYYSEGLLSFDTGANGGLSQKIKLHELTSDGGVFTFSLPFPYPIQVGDQYTVIAGCRKRLAEDCRDKFDNVLNFQGEPHLPGIDLQTANPRPSV